MKIQVFTDGAFAENSYLARCDDAGTAVVVDPGAGAGRLVEVIREEELDVVAVLLTHGHVDHVEGVPSVRSEVDAPIFLHPDDRPLYESAPEQARHFGVDLVAPPPPDRELRHGDTLTFGDRTFQVRHAPGHAPGHVILWDESRAVAFVGDVVFRGSIGRTDLPGGDFRELMRSIREQVLTLPDETRLLTGHGPETTVEDERTGNPFLVPHYGGELA